MMLLYWEVRSGVPKLLGRLAQGYRFLGRGPRATVVLGLSAEPGCLAGPDRLAALLAVLLVVLPPLR